jgi:hypothetical protein
MELTKQNLLQSIEDLGRIYMAFMGNYYGKRYVEARNPYDNKKVTVEFDFSQLKKLHFNVELDVGASSYWSEIASMQTIDNLLINNKITLLQYLERVPSDYIRDKHKLIDEIKGTMATPTPAPAGTLTTKESADSLPVAGGAGNGALQRALNMEGV